MSLHERAIKWVASKTNGKITHSYGSQTLYSYKGRIPDVVEPEKTIHEVETIHKMNADRIRKYSDVGLHKVLWIVFDINPLIGFNEVKVIHGVNDTFETTLEADANMQSLQYEVSNLVTQKENLIKEIATLKKELQFYLEAKPAKGSIVTKRVSPKTFWNACHGEGEKEW